MHYIYRDRATLLKTHPLHEVVTWTRGTEVHSLFPFVLVSSLKMFLRHIFKKKIMFCTTYFCIYHLLNIELKSINLLHCTVNIFYSHVSSFFSYNTSYIYSKLKYINLLSSETYFFLLMSARVFPVCRLFCSNL